MLISGGFAQLLYQGDNAVLFIKQGIDGAVEHGFQSVFIFFILKYSFIIFSCCLLFGVESWQSNIVIVYYGVCSRVFATDAGIHKRDRGIMLQVADDAALLFRRDDKFAVEACHVGTKSWRKPGSHEGVACGKTFRTVYTL